MPSPNWRRSRREVHVYIQLDRAWMINNIGAVIGSDDSLLMNTTSTEASNRALLASVASVHGSGPRHPSPARVLLTGCVTTLQARFLRPRR